MNDRLLKESDVLRIAFQLPLVVNSAFADAVKALPSADRPLGEWIINWDDRYRKCTNCNQIWWFDYGSYNSDFCPNCGADMRGISND